LGSDELFCGYEAMGDYFFNVIHATRLAGLPVAQWWKVFEVYDSHKCMTAPLEPFTGMARFCASEDFLNMPDRREYDGVLAPHRDFLHEYVAASHGNPDPSTYLIAHELCFRLPNTLNPSFSTGDSSVELRYPFLAPSMIEWALTLRLQDRITLSRDRWVYKSVVYDCARRLLPESIIKRPKRIYTAPFSTWLCGRPFAERVRDTLGALTFATDLLGKEFCNQFRRECDSLIGDRRRAPTLEFAYRCWILLTAKSWLDTHARTAQVINGMT
jgi:asparagine synthetase B (glutamine-hydrolysing)